LIHEQTTTGDIRPAGEDLLSQLAQGLIEDTIIARRQRQFIALRRRSISRPPGYQASAFSSQGSISAFDKTSTFGMATYRRFASYRSRRAASELLATVLSMRLRIDIYHLSATWPDVALKTPLPKNADNSIAFYDENFWKNFEEVLPM